MQSTPIKLSPTSSDNIVSQLDDLREPPVDDKAGVDLRQPVAWSTEDMEEDSTDDDDYVPSSSDDDVINDSESDFRSSASVNGDLHSASSGRPLLPSLTSPVIISSSAESPTKRLMPAPAPRTRKSDSVDENIHHPYPKLPLVGSVDEMLPRRTRRTLDLGSITLEELEAPLLFGAPDAEMEGGYDDSIKQKASDDDDSEEAYRTFLESLCADNILHADAKENLSGAGIPSKNNLNVSLWASDDDDDDYNYLSDAVMLGVDSLVREAEEGLKWHVEPEELRDLLQTSDIFDDCVSEKSLDVDGLRHIKAGKIALEHLRPPRCLVDSDSWETLCRQMAELIQLDIQNFLIALNYEEPLSLNAVMLDPERPASSCKGKEALDDSEAGVEGYAATRRRNDMRDRSQVGNIELFIDDIKKVRHRLQRSTKVSSHIGLCRLRPQGVPREAVLWPYRKRNINYNPLEVRPAARIVIAARAYDRLNSLRRTQQSLRQRYDSQHQSALDCPLLRFVHRVWCLIGIRVDPAARFIDNLAPEEWKQLESLANIPKLHGAIDWELCLLKSPSTALRIYERLALDDHVMSYILGDIAVLSGSQAWNPYLCNHDRELENSVLMLPSEDRLLTLAFERFHDRSFASQHIFPWVSMSYFNRKCRNSRTVARGNVQNVNDPMLPSFLQQTDELGLAEQAIISRSIRKFMHATVLASLTLDTAKEALRIGIGKGLSLEDSLSNCLSNDQKGLALEKKLRYDNGESNMWSDISSSTLWTYVSSDVVAQLPHRSDAMMLRSAWLNVIKIDKKRKNNCDDNDDNKGERCAVNVHTNDMNLEFYELFRSKTLKRRLQQLRSAYISSIERNRSTCRYGSWRYVFPHYKKHFSWDGISICRPAESVDLNFSRLSLQKIEVPINSDVVNVILDDEVRDDDDDDDENSSTETSDNRQIMTTCQNVKLDHTTSQHHSLRVPSVTIGKRVTTVPETKSSVFGDRSLSAWMPASIAVNSSIRLGNHLSFLHPSDFGNSLNSFDNNLSLSRSKSQSQSNSFVANGNDDPIEFRLTDFLVGSGIQSSLPPPLEEIIPVNTNKSNVDVLPDDLSSFEDDDVEEKNNHHKRDSTVEVEIYNVNQFCGAKYPEKHEKATTVTKMSIIPVATAFSSAVVSPYFSKEEDRIILFTARNNLLESESCSARLLLWEELLIKPRQLEIDKTSSNVESRYVLLRQLIIDRSKNKIK